MPPANAPLSLDEKLRSSRLELLDIGLRNNLVSFRKTAKSLVLQEPAAAELLALLLESEKALPIEATLKRGPGPVASEVSEGDPEERHQEALLEILSSRESTEAANSPARRAVLPADSDRSSRKRRVSLKAALTPDSLFVQLLKMRSEAQSFVEEQGANLLFLAIGFLHWYESEASEDRRKAPLVLIPCALIREGAGERFDLEPTGEDVVVNLSLAAKLKTDFGITLPVPEVSEEGEGNDWIAYLKQVEIAVAVQKRWAVDANETVLGFFSFGKFLMFKDLDPATWPEDKQPSSHPVVRRLMGEGFGEQGPALDEDVNIDQIIKPGDIHFVKDADSSQTQAILEAREGRNLVIQGPPGTGKSQTITNLIAELIGSGKRVLFVAEKMAALEVVKRRLDDCHLGDAVLELHSHRATKATVLKELGRSLEQGRPVHDGSERDLEQLKKVQDELNAYCTAVAAPVAKSRMSFCEVLGHYMGTQQKWPSIAPLLIDEMLHWTDTDFAEARELAQSMALLLSSTGVPRQNPFWGSTLRSFTPVDENSARQKLAHGRKAMEGMWDCAGKLAARLQLAAAVTLQDIDVVCRAARRAALAPKLDGVQLSTQDWQLRRDSINALILAGSGMARERAEYHDHLIDAAWDQDVLQLRQAIQQYGSKWWKPLSAEWRKAKKRLGSLCKAQVPVEQSRLLELVDGVLAYQQHKKNYDQVAAVGLALFGAQWQGEQSEWEVLDRLARWVIALHDEVGKGQLPQGIVKFLAGHADASGLGDMADVTEECVRQLSASVHSIAGALKIPCISGDAALHTLPLDELEQTLERWAQHLSDLHPLARFNTIGEQFIEAGLHSLLTFAEECAEPETLLPLLELSWYSMLTRQAYADRPVLAHFDRLQQEYRIKRFKELDIASIGHTQAELAKRIWDRRPKSSQAGEMAILLHEINKKRRHLPIRQLIDKAGRAIQQLKPVFMMSPMSIANFLAPGRVEFDVVIFDEASQVKAVDALGAILRGRQVIVVGDTRQMPPTDFFSREIEQDEDSSTGDLESILSMFKAKGCNERYLRWHYRSRHESLIAVSNAEFYHGKLVVFPAAGVDRDAAGISLRYLPHALYDRGRTRTNKGEAAEVAKAVIEHALKSPHLSLGVAAFSVAQRDLIEIEVELVRRETPQADEFFARHSHEPFFVKNLENIQGDERDVILISIGYGRNETGKIAKEFGPLNRDGGHRRLNVLITRAKMAMTVFSNFRGDELELDASAKHGVRALKHLLKYAETRELEASVETGKAADSPFEEQVIACLRERGYQVEPQVGSAGYFIDMAVRDPDLPGRYLLAIECDGAAYHSSRSARDRDRLRQGVLEGLGWRFHRIWSTDWFRNREQELQRVDEAIGAATQALKAQTPAAIAAPASDNKAALIRTQPTPEAQPAHVQAYQAAKLVAPGGYELLDAPSHLLADMVKTVVDMEAPVGAPVIVRRVMDAFGLSRAGARISARVEDVLARCARESGWIVQDGFVMKREHHSDLFNLPIRDRTALPAGERKIEMVCGHEIRSGLLKTIKLAFTISEDSAVAEVAQLLGFGRASSKISTVIESQLKLLVQAGHVKVDHAGMLSAQ